MSESKTKKPAHQSKTLLTLAATGVAYYVSTRYGVDLPPDAYATAIGDALFGVTSLIVAVLRLFKGDLAMPKKEDFLKVMLFGVLWFGPGCQLLQAIEQSDGEPGVSQQDIVNTIDYVNAKLDEVEKTIDQKVLEHDLYLTLIETAKGAELEKYRLHVAKVKREIERLREDKQKIQVHLDALKALLQ